MNENNDFITTATINAFKDAMIAKEENEHNLNDLTTLRVKGGDWNNPDISKRPTDPKGLSLSILHVLSNKGCVNVKSVGNVALGITMKAFRLAAEEVASKTSATVLVIRQTEYDVFINDKKFTGINTRIFPIPTKNAL